ncbi:hypothetical protein BLNAU_15802 [Blattamonas nauphoetae]|uniref:Uncharacterized protein n=1 Tax=Blattamonas nauphoetae TaxID=2049346 RepID=A0ABQ9XDM4_9EUKA|nr:hypothetical protein BLNAU_15802 [Blattamonas nauphoetae]
MTKPLDCELLNSYGLELSFRPVIDSTPLLLPPRRRRPRKSQNKRKIAKRKLKLLILQQGNTETHKQRITTQTTPCPPSLQALYSTWSESSQATSDTTNPTLSTHRQKKRIIKKIMRNRIDYAAKFLSAPTLPLFKPMAHLHPFSVFIFPT